MVSDLSHPSCNGRRGKETWTANWVCRMLWRPANWWAVHNKMQSPIILLPSASPCQPGNWACSPAWHKANRSCVLSFLLLLVSGALALWGRWAVQAPGSFVVPAAFPAVLDKQFPLVQHFSSLLSLSPPTSSNAAGRELPFGRKKKISSFLFLILWI